IPRLINQICERALNQAYHQGKKKVGGSVVKQLAKDPLYRPLFDLEVKPWWQKPSFLGPALILCVGMILGLWYFEFNNKPVPTSLEETGQVPVEGRLNDSSSMVASPISGVRGDEPGSPGPVKGTVTSPAPRSEGVEELRADSQLPPGEVNPVVLQQEPERSEVRVGEDVLAKARGLETAAGSSTQSAQKRFAYSTEVSKGAELPGHTISAIAWDEDPSKRIVVLNDRIVHEGDLLGDTTILKINPDHVVLLHQNEHYIERMPTIEDDSRSSDTPGTQPSEKEHIDDAKKTSDKNHVEQRFSSSDFRQTVNFGYKTSKLPPEAFDELDRLVTIAKKNPNQKIIVRGYTDTIGTYEYNQKLSESRAKIVQGYLVGKGIDVERISTFGLGAENPLKSNTTAEGRAANRRVEIELVRVGD
ncbi:MAG: OmpA family protein, partial [Deltaproteobacteria bacterium]